MTAEVPVETKTKGKILIVDDETVVRDSLGKWFSSEGYQAKPAGSAREALEVIANAEFDVALLDIKMPGMDGMELQARLREADPELTVIIMTGYASVETAVQALKQGAYDYITKPIDPDELSHLVSKALEHRRARREVVRLREDLQEVSPSTELIGKAPAMKKVCELIEMVAPTEATVLITGESGTGKEVVARAIHAAGPRRGFGRRVPTYSAKRKTTAAPRPLARPLRRGDDRRGCGVEAGGRPMTAVALISGALSRAPELRTAKIDGKPFFATATIKVAADNAVDFWSVLAFSESAQAELLRLGEGDKVSLQGSLKLEVYISRDGEHEISRTLFADHVLALRQPPRERKPKADKPERSAPDNRPTADPSLDDSLRSEVRAMTPLDAALRYAARGWPVFPCPRQKTADAAWLLRCFHGRRHNRGLVA